MTVSMKARDDSEDLARRLQSTARRHAIPNLKESQASGRGIPQKAPLRPRFVDSIG